MTHVGIDMSEWQEAPAALIDEHRPAFVGLKLTEGAGYRVGQGWLDDALAKCRALDLPVIFYHFARPDRGTPQDDLGNFLGALSGMVGQLRDTDAVALDFEQAPADAGWAQTWLDQCRLRLGRIPLFYSYPSFIDGMAWLPAYPLWLAHYHVPAPALPNVIWQYTDDPIDLNQCDDIRAVVSSLRPQKATAVAVQFAIILNSAEEHQLVQKWLGPYRIPVHTPGHTEHVNEALVVGRAVTDPALKIGRYLHYMCVGGGVDEQRHLFRLEEVLTVLRQRLDQRKVAPPLVWVGQLF